MKKKLEAVNILLRIIGEAPLLNEDDLQYSYEAEVALEVLDTTKRDVLTEGFKFNKINVALTPDVQKYIAVPPNALAIFFNDVKYSVNEGMVYNKETLSFYHDNSIDCVIMYDEEFDYIPLVLQNYIIAKAKVAYQRDMVNDSRTEELLLRDLHKAERDKNVWHINQIQANGKSPLFNRRVTPTRA